MVDSGYQDIDRESGRDKDVLEAILLWGGLILATLSVDKGN